MSGRRISGSTMLAKLAVAQDMEQADRVREARMKAHMKNADQSTGKKKIRAILKASIGG